jgi:cysteine desulfurase/selenocysteine lyase
MEHHSNIVPWQMLCDRVGARLRVIPIDDTGRLRMEQLGSLMNERTRLLAICAVSNVLGSANPVAEVIARAHEQEVPVLIDAAQAVQHMPIDVRSLGCDFLVFSGHKMFAETGIGVLFAKEHWLKNMPPYQYGGGMIETVNFERTTFAEIPFRFEAGTPNIAGAISLNTAIDYIRTIGLENICAHEQTLRRYALNRLSGIDGMTVYGNGENGCGSVSFNLDGVSPYDVAVLLDKMGIAVRSGTHCAEPVMRRFGVGGMVRASFALYNTCEEVDMLVDGVGRAGAMLR